MSACEKCWGDAFTRAYGRGDTDQATEYRRLLDERKDNPCTPEEQRGPVAETPAELHVSLAIALELLGEVSRRRVLDGSETSIAVNKFLSSMRAGR